MARRKRRKKSLYNSTHEMSFDESVESQFSTLSNKKKNRSYRLKKREAPKSIKLKKNVSRETNKPKISTSKQINEPISEPKHKPHYRKEIRSPRQIAYTEKQKREARQRREQKALEKKHGFDKVDGLTPFDKEFNSEYQNFTDQFNKEYAKSILKQQQIRFNLTSEDKRRNTFQEKYGIFGKDYDILTSILGSDLFRELVESKHLDSTQIMDLVSDYSGSVTAEQIEKSLLNLISGINKEYSNTVNVIRDAMDMGFTFDEAVYLTEQDRTENYAPVKGLSQLKDLLEKELSNSKSRENIKKSLWDMFSS